MYFHANFNHIIMETQKFGQCLENSLKENIIRRNNGKKMKMYPMKIMQVSTRNMLTDSIIEIPFRLEEAASKKESLHPGSFIRINDWQFDTSEFEIVIYNYEYLGGVNCKVNHGRKYNFKKIETLLKSICVTNQFSVLLDHENISNEKISWGSTFNSEHLDKLYIDLKTQERKSKEDIHENLKADLPAKQIAKENHQFLGSFKNLQIHDNEITLPPQKQLNSHKFEELGKFEESEKLKHTQKQNEPEEIDLNEKEVRKKYLDNFLREKMKE